MRFVKMLLWQLRNIMIINHLCDKNVTLKTMLF